MYREVESPEWFLLCLELGNPSSVSLPAVPMCYCCEKKTWARVDTGALCDRFPLGSLEGFAIETFNSKEEGSGFFQVTHLAVCLTLNLPRCCFPYRQPHLSAAVSQSYCLTGNLLTLCPTVRAPPGSVSCSSVLLLRNQKVQKDPFFIFTRSSVSLWRDGAEGGNRPMSFERRQCALISGTLAQVLEGTKSFG